MMASSPRVVFTVKRKFTTRVCLIILALVLQNPNILAMSSIHGVHESLTARVGDTVNLHFEYCDRPRPVCTLAQSFNLSAPNPTCTVDRYGHCEVVPAPVDDQLRQGLDNVCELCVLVIHRVTLRDAGRYAICQTSGACTSSFWRNISTLEVVSEIVEPPTPTASTSTKVSTKPTTDSTTKTTKTTKPEDLTKNVSEINSIPDTGSSSDNEAHSGMNTSSAVGIPITIVILVIVFIACAVYFYIYKRRNRRQNTPLAPESPYADTTTVPITEGCHDGANLETPKEDTCLRADPELNT